MKRNDKLWRDVEKANYPVFGEYPVKDKKKENDVTRKYVVPWELTNGDIKKSFY
ncbi:hypothetical protein OU798_03130 [Prolixibacteraceae bacterium Z1-6]|uniref:Uncharacterized protein n=1 Tax=Draconibacterium aestuarii TaxID=2998507 RepID=A0A9X3F2E7_9BACT|nr:hypothetical protein [Prolixibacteraceae bacterium Z1-6]